MEKLFLARKIFYVVNDLVYKKKCLVFKLKNQIFFNMLIKKVL